MATIAELEKRVKQLEADNAELVAKVETLASENAQLMDDVATQEAAVQKLTEGQVELLEQRNLLDDENKALHMRLEEGANLQPSAKQQRGESVPDFMKPDYDGPLTATQALKREAKLKAERNVDKVTQTK